MKTIIDVSTLFGFWPRRNVDISLEQLLKLMDTHDIEKAFTLSARGIFIDSRRGNEETLKAHKMYPGRLIPVAVLDPRAMLSIDEEVDWCIEQGFRHIRLFPDIQSWSNNNLVWRQLLDVLISRNFPVLHLPAIFGLANIDKVADVYSGSIVVHQAKFPDEAELTVLFKRRKNVFAEISYFIGVGAIERLDKAGLSDRLLLGTNMPLNYPASVIEIIKSLRNEQLRQKIFFENAKRLEDNI